MEATQSSSIRIISSSFSILLVSIFRWFCAFTFHWNIQQISNIILTYQNFLSRNYFALLESSCDLYVFKTILYQCTLYLSCFLYFLLSRALCCWPEVLLFSVYDFGLSSTFPVWFSISQKVVTYIVSSSEVRFYAPSP